MKLTHDQQKAVNECVIWAIHPYDPLNPAFIIRGFAGTGKSTIVNKVIKRLNFRVAVCAPTHKALRVLKNMGSVKTYTVHSALGLRLNTNIDNFDIRKPNFDPRSKPKFDEFSIMVFDEASMIPKPLYNFILSMADKHKTKVIFVGDPLQLPPVGEHISEALAFRPNNFHDLKTVVRQEKGHPILELLSAVRNDILNGTSTHISLLKSNPDNIVNGVGYKVYPAVQFKQKLKDVFSKPEYESDINFVKYLAYTNDNIRKANEIIRGYIIDGSDKEILTKNDLITSYSTIIEPQLLQQKILNSDDYIPTSVTPYKSVDGFDGFSVTLKNIYSGGLTSMFIIDHTKPSMVKFILKLGKIHENAIRNKEIWPTYYAFKNANVTMKRIKIYNKFNPKGVIVDRDLDYAYGSTIHKAQGSTYQHAFVNLLDINKAARIEGIPFRNRLIYVALSRIQKSAYILM